jgi:hypothetical protein
MPPLAINSSISLILVFAVRKMISSLVSLSTMFHWIAWGRLKIFLMSDVLHGLVSAGQGGVNAEIVESCQN